MAGTGVSSGEMWTNAPKHSSAETRIEIKVEGRVLQLVCDTPADADLWLQYFEGACMMAGIFVGEEAEEDETEYYDEIEAFGPTRAASCSATGSVISSRRQRSDSIASAKVKCCAEALTCYAWVYNLTPFLSFSWFYFFYLLFSLCFSFPFFRFFNCSVLVCF